MSKKEKKKRKLWQRILLWCLNIVIALVGAFVVLIVILFVTEYRPNAVERVGMDRVLEDEVPLNTPLTLMTYNIGYGALGDNADFFMDGGKSVKTATTERIFNNMEGIAATTAAIDPDFAFFQEVDKDASRSNHMDEVSYLEMAFPGYENAFAYNFRVLFIPYPVPPIGEVNAGILSLSKYEVADAERLQLPCPFKGIERLGNLKRCLLVSHLPIEGSEHELVLVNLHLEAYDSGEGKAAQTSELQKVLMEEYEKGNYVIAGGDFNQTFSGVDMTPYPVYPDRWQPGLIDESILPEDWSFVMDNQTPSCRSLDQPLAGADLDHFQYYMIDGFIVSPNVRILKAETIDTGFVDADHNPVVMQVELAE